MREKHAPKLFPEQANAKNERKMRECDLRIAKTREINERASSRAHKPDKL